MKYVIVKEEELYSRLVSDIEEIFPIKKPRVSFNANGSIKREKLEIEIYFSEDRAGKISRLIYLKKNGCIGKAFVVNDTISIDNIGKIYQFILDAFSFVKKVSYQDGEFKLESGIDKNKYYLEGISCSDIGLSIGYKSNLSLNIDNEIFSWYDYFVNNFENLLNRVPNQKNRIVGEHNCFRKRNIINNMSKEELDGFINFIDDETLKFLLKKIKISRFFELLYNKFKVRFPIFDNGLMNDLIDKSLSIDDIKEMINSLDESEKKEMLKSIKADEFFELYNYFTSKDNDKDREYLKLALSAKKTGNHK